MKRQVSVSRKIANTTVFYFEDIFPIFYQYAKEKLGIKNCQKVLSFGNFA
jgi:hypothetical protein